MACAIITKYLGPTNVRGSRVKATAGYRDFDGKVRSLTLSWDHSLDGFGNHEKVARTLAKQLDWVGPWSYGEIKGNYIFVRSTCSCAF